MLAQVHGRHQLKSLPFVTRLLLLPTFLELFRPKIVQVEVEIHRRRLLCAILCVPLIQDLCVLLLVSWLVIEHV